MVWAKSVHVTGGRQDDVMRIRCLRFFVMDLSRSLSPGGRARDCLGSFFSTLFCKYSPLSVERNGCEVQYIETGPIYIIFRREREA